MALAPAPIAAPEPQRVADSTFAWGTAAQRPTATPQYLGWLYLATDTDGGTLYACRFVPGSGLAWVQVSRGVTAVDFVSSAAPLLASSAGTAGQSAYDSSFIYVCVAADTWKRAALTTW